MFAKGIDSFKVVEDLPNHLAQDFRPPIQLKKRDQIKIGIIDDQPFVARNNLKNHGYDFYELGDIKSITEVAPYPIILCDLMDVGLQFNKTKQGAAIIREIRKNYPSVLIAAYSGSPATTQPVQLARDLADAFIKKDAEIDEWVDQLDKLIAKATDPRYLWRRTRTALINMDVDTRSILRLEDAYVSAILSGDRSFSTVKQVMNSKSVNGIASNIVLNLLSSAIFEVIAG